MNTISSQSLITTTFSPSPTPTARQCTPAHRFRSICRSTPSNDGGSSEQQPPPPAINEDLIRRLREAEEEAQVLKKELAAAKAASATSTPSTQDPLPSAPAFKRIDGGDLRRETLAFVESKSRNWLSESDVDFFTGGGPSEASTSSPSAAAAADATATAIDQAVIQRRILIGLGISAGLGAFALIPTERLQPPPSQPLFFYLVPLLRAQRLLQEAKDIIPNGEYTQLQALLSRIEGAPNNVQDNLRSAAASLPDAKAAEAADQVARDVYEYVKGIDYQTYYESVGGGMGSKSRGGSREKELFEYSLQSAEAAAVKLKEFLALMPRDQVEAAELQANTPIF